MCIYTQFLGWSAKAWRTLWCDLGSQSLVSNPFPTEGNTGLLGKMTDSRTGQEKHKMSLEHLMMPGIKEVLKKNGVCHKDSGANFVRLPSPECRMI